MRFQPSASIIYGTENPMNRPFKLYRLQQIDSQLDWLQKRMEEIDAILNNNETLQQALQEAETAELAYQEAHSALRQAEYNVLQQRIKIEQAEATLYGGKVRNPKELKDLENELASLKRYLSVLEDRQLDNMLAEEEKRSTRDLARDELEKVKNEFEQQASNLLGEQARLENDVHRTTEERQAASSSIEANDLTIYTELRAKRRGIAVSKVNNKTCSACGSTLNAALLHAARSPNQINRCDACGRILYAG